MYKAILGKALESYSPFHQWGKLCLIDLHIRPNLPLNTRFLKSEICPIAVGSKETL
jgi:hypothetical protein